VGRAFSLGLKKMTLIYRWTFLLSLTLGVGSCSDDANLKAGQEFKDCDDCPMMVIVPAGNFKMGSPSDEQGREEDEGPAHEVMLSKAIAVGKYEVTRGQYAAFIFDSGYNSDDGCWVWDGSGWKPNASQNWRDPNFPQTDQHPVTCINWADAQAYISWLSQKTGQGYRLLSEAEWEYAARGGTSTPFSFGQGITTDQANFNGEPSGAFREGTTSVGVFPVNAFGLHDMHGNLWEWTDDCSNGSYEGAPNDGSAWLEGDCDRHVLRGGSWTNEVRSLRSAERVKHSGDPAARGAVDGFRITRALD
jgi:formylglycine-generating enzyme required for sulfatase activity